MDGKCHVFSIKQKEPVRTGTNHTPFNCKKTLLCSCIASPLLTSQLSKYETLVNQANISNSVVAYLGYLIQKEAENKPQNINVYCA